MKMVIFLFSMLLLGSVCFSQAVPIAAPAPAAVVAAPAQDSSSGNAILNFLSGLIQKIPDHLPSIVITIIGILGELILRIYPSAKPQSIPLYAAALFHLLGDLFTKLANLLDSVLPNNIKQ